ncbi:Uncharacterized protein dnl_54630 [Desulfonema limicola]|uniref:Uncharacterized protein n=1 Tax=Desulfonema limicola TaxID=45656 RepID=A0A975GIY6_9BACT|nr:hypothetical protein [Desulfonema limicola]QTA83070.1 Uncharacterized protein dnl_54630 [Desulfonema limicola]
MITQFNEKRFVLCINNKGNEASLEQWKVYQCLPDKEADIHNEIRVIDEEGEDYLYPSDCFSPVILEPYAAEIFLLEHAAVKT